MYLCLKKTFAFQKQQDLLNISEYCCFPGFVILPVRMDLTACLVFYLVIIFLLKLLRLKIYFHSPSGLDQVLFLTLELIVKAKRIRGGDKVLEQHLKNCSRNASYISKTSQNDLVSCCGQFIAELVVRKIKENKFFSVLADEASDCSNQEPLSLVIRYVGSDCVIREEFLGF